MCTYTLPNAATLADTDTYTCSAVVGTVTRTASVAVAVFCKFNLHDEEFVDKNQLFVVKNYGHFRGSNQSPPERRVAKISAAVVLSNQKHKWN